MTAPTNLIANRAARIAFGLVLLAGMLFIVTCTITTDKWLDHGPDDMHMWHLILGTWLAALIVAGVVRAVATLLHLGGNPETLRHAALAVPAVGIALLLPLTLHMPFIQLAGSEFFDAWAFISLFAAGAAHVVFALFVLVRANQLVAGREPVSIKTIYLWTCVAGAVPVVVPAIFVAITGIPCIRLLIYMERVAYRDRVATGELPFAVARAA
jgi:hypothetical protein